MTTNSNNRSGPKSPNVQPKPRDEQEATRVDLGDDLIEKTAILTSSDASASVIEELLVSRDKPKRDEPVESRLHSARILIGEGLLEQAKRILHRILVEDAGCIDANKALEEIHELELKQIFGDETGRRTYHSRDRANQPTDADDVLEQLDRELSLGLDPTDRKDLPALLRDAQNFPQITARIEAELSQVSTQDRIDIGIGFLEMGLAELAVAQFRAALHAFAREQRPDPKFVVSATCLTALALMAASKPLDAEFELQPLLNDTDIPIELKLELFYLMGRIQEQLGKRQAATGWFNQVTAINPKYRDVRERLAKTR